MMSEGSSEGQKHLNFSLSQDIKIILRAFIFHINVRLEQYIIKFNS